MELFKLMSFLLTLILGAGVLGIAIIWTYMKLFEMMVTLFGVKKDFIHFMLDKRMYKPQNVVSKPYKIKKD